jgi:hypothetical protein
MNYGQVISQANDQELLVYREFGDYQGDWIAITKDEEKYYVYKGYYGSCSGCDALQDFSHYAEEGFWTKEKLQEFAVDYPPFIDVEKETFLELLRQGKLIDILPANTRLDYDVDYTDVDDNYVFKELEKELADELDNNLEN